MVCSVIAIYLIVKPIDEDRWIQSRHHLTLGTETVLSQKDSFWIKAQLLSQVKHGRREMKLTGCIYCMPSSLHILYPATIYNQVRSNCLSAWRERGWGLEVGLCLITQMFEIHTHHNACKLQMMQMCGVPRAHYSVNIDLYWPPIFGLAVRSKTLSWTFKVPTEYSILPPNY